MCIYDHIDGLTHLAFKYRLGFRLTFMCKWYLVQVFVIYLVFFYKSMYKYPNLNLGSIHKQLGPWYMCTLVQWVISTVLQNHIHTKVGDIFSIFTESPRTIASCLCTKTLTATLPNFLPE